MQESKPFCVKVEGGQRYQRLIPGEPLTRGLKSGCVTLQPGESVGEHVTEGKEEAILVVQGTAQVSCAGFGRMDVEAPAIAYVPVDTRHDVTNIGAGVLLYVYVVSPVREEKG